MGTMKKSRIYVLLISFLTSCLSPEKKLNKAQIIEGFASTIEKQFKEVPQMTIENYLQLKDQEKLVLVDVRNEEERSVSIIPMAISQKQFEAHKSQFKRRKIVAYCTIGSRSSKYASHLRNQGFKAYNLRESVLGWALRGHPFEKNGSPTKRVHVYSRAWNFLPNKYEAIYEN